MRGRRIKVELLFSKKAAAWVKDKSWHPSQETKLLKDGRLKMTLKVADNDELVGWILSFGGEVRGMAPGPLRQTGKTTNRVGFECADFLLARADGLPAGARWGIPTGIAQNSSHARRGRSQSCCAHRSIMNETVQFLIHYGYALLFAWVWIEQMGLPIPAIPLLLGAGALAGSERMSWPLSLGLAIVAAVAADLFWYYLGRYRGGRVLKLLCRISLEPDSCVRRTEDVFVRHGARSLLVAKFVPGLNTAAPSLAGIFRMPVWRFVLFDGLGAFFWAATFIGLGYLFSDQLERAAAYALRWGGGLALAIAASFAAYVLWKFVQRQRFLHQLRIARISPQRLMDKLRAGEPVMVIDLRQPLDIETQPYTIPGALRMAVEELEQRHEEIPRDRDVVLYCS
jgi:membrane protein DedA with SNARE-associated domain